MAHILNVEKPQYINTVIDTYTKLRVGEYSKFLQSTPIFVTYYHINEVLSKSDVGTGSIEVELGNRSPIKFNKIKNFPIYNLPELRPDLNYSEDSGYDIELELSDITILPNTIKPRPGDYFIVKIPNAKEFLFRVNAFEYNTIQSNDFYRISADIKDVGDDLELKRMKGQVANTYLTVFENIGTQDRCFIKEEDVDYLNSLADLYHKLRDWYKNAFYIRDLNSFSYMTGRFSETGRPIYRYDPYLENFINLSHIYYDKNKEETLLLSPAAPLEELNFKRNNMETLYYALLTRSIELLKPYCYIVTSVITSPFSIYNRMQYFGEVANVFTYNKKPSTMKTYAGRKKTACPCCSIPVEDETGVVGDTFYNLDKLPFCTPIWQLDDGIEYFSHEFLCALLNHKIDTDDYCELIIFNYLHGVKMKIDRQEIMQHLEVNEHIFYFLPMVIYCIGALYQNYFATEDDIDG